MLSWFKNIIRLKPEQQLEEIESREPSLEERLERLVSRMGRYKHKNMQDLDEIIDDLNKVLDIVEKLVTTLQNIGGQIRAEELLTKLRNNRTRAGNARKALAA
ncbi:MAG: hypothetical protein WCR46_00090 [Deltaproteobacteria bacterium]